MIVRFFFLAATHHRTLPRSSWHMPSSPGFGPRRPAGPLAQVCVETYSYDQVPP